MNGLFLAVAILIAACTSQSVKQEASVETRHASFTLLHQANRFGTLEPCGCHYNPYGGIDREFNALTGIRRLNRPLLYVDGGNLFMLPDQTKKVKLELLQKKALAMRGMLNKMGLQIFAPGPNDYALGTDFLKTLESEAKFAFISSNVTKDQKPVFKPYLIQQVGNVRVGVISATPQGSLMDTTLVVEEPKAAIQKWTAELRPKVNVIVLLSQLKHKDLDAMVEDLDLDIIVGGDQNLVSNEALTKRNNKTLVVENSNDGYRLGKLDLDLTLPQTGFYSLQSMYSLDSEIISVEKAVKKEPKNAEAQKYLEHLKAKRAAHVPEGNTSYRHALLNLDPDRFGSPNEITKMVKDYRAALRKRAISE